MMIKLSLNCFDLIGKDDMNKKKKCVLLQRLLMLGKVQKRKMEN